MNQVTDNHNLSCQCQLSTNGLGLLLQNLQCRLFIRDCVKTFDNARRNGYTKNICYLSSVIFIMRPLGVVVAKLHYVFQRFQHNKMILENIKTFYRFKVVQQDSVDDFNVCLETLYFFYFLFSVISFVQKYVIILI